MDARARKGKRQLPVMREAKKDEHGNFDVTQLAHGDHVAIFATVAEVTGSEARFARLVADDPNEKDGETWISREAAKRLIDFHEKPEAEG